MLQTHLFNRRLPDLAVAALARVVRNPWVARAAVEAYRRDLGIPQLLASAPARSGLHLDLTPIRGLPSSRLPRALAAPAADTDRHRRSGDMLRAAYATGSNDPLRICRRVFDEARALSERHASLACLYVQLPESAAREAAESAARFRGGVARGPLDGVPIVIEEELAITGLPHRMGTSLPSDPVASSDSTVVSRLRAAGAVLVAQSAMTELGLSVLGNNPHRPALRNPHDLSRCPGGSGTGAGVAVATGLVPLGVAVDAGGSVRIPASLLGVFGLQPTFGLVSRAGDAAEGSLAHIGPIGASPWDLASFLDGVVGVDPGDPHTRGAPMLDSTFAGWLQRRIPDLRIGVPHALWAEASPDVRAACEGALHKLAQRGATLVPIEIPGAELAPAAGYVILCVETYATMWRTFERERGALSPGMQILLPVAERLGMVEYFAALSAREALRGALSRVLRTVDVIALPTTSITAPRMREVDERTGFVDAHTTDLLCRNSFLTTLTGLPAGTAPVGVDAQGLPIGLQIIGDAWDDGVVLSVLADLERAGASESVRPAHHVDLLG